MAAKRAPSPEADFFEPEEKAFIDEFLERGFAVIPLEERQRLDRVRERMHARAMELLGLKASRRPALEEFFEHTERFVPIDRLNGFRLGMIERLNRDPLLRPALFRMARRQVEWAIGSEIAMQRAVNLSIQLPGDDSSLLPLHSDVWSGNSPYEIVLWVPLVDCYRTKSMYILERRHSEKVFRDFAKYRRFDAERLYNRLKPKLEWLDVPYGRAVIFTHSLLHGNRVNREKTTRWTFNIRLKGLLTPYGVKEMGESFLPITTRPATRIGFEAVTLER